LFIFADAFPLQMRSNDVMTSSLDPILCAADAALRTLFAKPQAMRPTPSPAAPASALTDDERREAAALMRVNHVGEICAQALYTAQAAVTRDPALRSHFTKAAHEETDHLAWTQQRLDELSDRRSLLNPLWYAGAFGLGLVAGRLGDAWSLGFVAETEQQVEAHLDSHLDRLPAGDTASRAVVQQMKEDEARHASDAWNAVARDLPAPVKAMMRMAARVMTTVAHRV
jgi:ubiquinone biosynthesis monooxygenase Coq7